MPFNEAFIMNQKLKHELAATAALLVADGKGILAADESVGSISRKFAGIQLENTEETRRQYRELLFTAGPALHDYVSGVIMHEESLFQETSSGESFVSVLQNSGLIVGVKVDKGTITLQQNDNNLDKNLETVTEGLDGLKERCQNYYKHGARFAKWRSVFKIKQPYAPSALAIELNATSLAQYANICQSVGLVPIVEPDILMDGEHDMQTTHKCCKQILSAVIKKLQDSNVYLEGILIKTNFILPGINCKTEYYNEDIAKATLDCLAETIPPVIPGIVFLSGGLSEQRATILLNAVNRINNRNLWKLSFSYGRAMQNSAIDKWHGKQENLQLAQKILLGRAKANSEAAQGKYYEESAKSEKLSTTTFDSNYSY